MIARHLQVPSSHSVAKADDTTKRLMDKWVPLSDPKTPEELAANKAKAAYANEYFAKREKYPLTADERVFAGLLASGRLTHSYHAVVVCNTHKCAVDYNHLETCTHFSVNGVQPHQWLWALKDEEKDLYDHVPEMVEQITTGIKTVLAKYVAHQATGTVTVWDLQTPAQHAAKLEELNKLAIKATAEGLSYATVEVKNTARRIENLKKQQASANAAELRKKVAQDR